MFYSEKQAKLFDHPEPPNCYYFAHPLIDRHIWIYLEGWLATFMAIYICDGYVLNSYVNFIHIITAVLNC